MRVLLLLIVLVACSSSTAPNGKAGDPALLFTNNLDSSWVYITWQDGNAVVGRDSIPPKTASQCVRFLAQPDSAKWIITAHENGVTSTVGGAWFNPADRPAWQVTVSSLYPASPAIRAVDVAVAC